LTKEPSPLEGSFLLHFCPGNRLASLEMNGKGDKKSLSPFELSLLRWIDLF
jgi:hypothetical protein